MPTTPTPADLLPALANVLASFQSTPDYSVATGFEIADALHLLAAVGGHRPGDVLEVWGYCLSLDDQGQPYALLAYVRPSATHSVCYTERQAARFPAAGQQERWLSNVRPLLLTEIDITDHADELALERRPVAAAAPSAPAQPTHQPAARQRKAA